jgi:hypothetical protein
MILTITPTLSQLYLFEILPHFIAPGVTVALSALIWTTREVLKNSEQQKTQDRRIRYLRKQVYTLTMTCRRLLIHLIENSTDESKPELRHIIRILLDKEDPTLHK